MSEFTTAYPDSSKVFVGGPGGIRVPMREIALAGGEPPLRVYDTSGPQGHDVASGLPKLREPWVGARRVRAASGRSGHAAPLRPQGRDHAGDGVHRHPRGPAGRLRARRGGSGPRDHPGQYQSPRARADDHRPQLPGEDQRQHRQLRGHLVDRGGGREAALGDPVGRRHRDGSVDGQEHPRDARVDHQEFRGADRHGSDLSGARKGRADGRKISPGRSTATRSSSSASRAWTTSPSTPACCCATSR